MQAGLDPSRLIFIDETWIKTNMTRLRGRALRGQRLVEKVPHGHWKTTTVIGALDHKGQVEATHRRSRTPGEQVLEPTHFLAAIERKPAYLDHTKLFKELKLPAVFNQLRERLEKDLGDRTGTRHYIRVLQLLGRHSTERVAQQSKRI